jgi:hypothetical protein
MIKTRQQELNLKLSLWLQSQVVLSGFTTIKYCL